MADKETGFNITVGAEADVNSAKKAVKDISNAVDSSVKGGRIEVPVDITVPIDKSKDKLTKAQKDITAAISKMITKGFSASGKDIDALTSKFNEFTKAFDQAGKGRQNKIFREIRRQVEDLQKSYRNLQKTTRTGNTKIDRSSQKPKTRKSKNFSLPSEEEINANIKAEQKRRLKGLKQAGPKGFKSNSGINLGSTNPQAILESEASPYGNNWQRTQAQHKIEEDKKTAANTKRWVDKNYESSKGKGRATTDKEYNEDVAKKALSDLRKIIVSIEKGVEGITPEQVQTQLGIVKDLFQKNGKDLEETSIAIKNALEKPYSDSELKVLGGTKGGEKGVGPGHDVAKSTQKMIYDIWTKLIEATEPAIVYAKRFAKEMLEANNSLKKATKALKTDKRSAYSKTVTEASQSDSVKQIQAIGASLNSGIDATKTAVTNNQQATENQTAYDKVEHSAERVADAKQNKGMRKSIDDIEQDTRTGFNTDTKSDKVISLLESILSAIQKPGKIGGKGSLVPKFGAEDLKRVQNALKPITQLMLPSGKSPLLLNAGNQSEVSRSKVSTTVKNPHSWITKLKDNFAALTKTTANYKVIMSKTSKEQDDLLAARISKYGLDRGGGENPTGDKISFARRLSLFRGKDTFKDLFKDINLSEGVTVDTTAITDKLAKTLSGKEMFKAQTGGWMKNIAGAMTGGLAFAFQPSLEKSRAQADALNTIMAKIRSVVNAILQDIQTKESALAGMQESGDLKLGENGEVLSSSTSEAKAMALSLEESKQRLTGVLADVGQVDDVVDKTGGRVSSIIKQLGFASPELRDNNKILANVNAGLNKGGKALKFQTRMGEILNYSFQLMGRHVGQLFKRLMLLLNPFNLIKKAFTDFSSYDVKWQRTMNVIKYNLRRIIRPFMEWLAQQLVNILGVINAIIKGIGQAFGKDWDLFDQSAANAEKMREELEAAANVTASFDELHDIGSDNTAAGDLMGEIYTPQWGDLYETITEKAKALTEFLIPIFEKLGKVIKWCLDHWKWLVAAFAAYKIGKGLLALWNFFSGLGNLIGGLPAIFGKVMAGIAGVALTALSQIGTVELGKKWDQMSKSDRWKKVGINIGEGIAGGALIGFAIGGPTGAAVGAGIGGLVTGFEQLAIAAYNGSEAATVAAEALGAAGLGGAIGFLVGGPVGAAVGAIGGALVGALAGAATNALRCKGEFNKLKISADDLAWAQQQTADATNSYYSQLAQLEQLEQQTGLSGEALYDSVRNGTLAVDDMTSAQYAVYQSYLNTKDALETLQKAQKQELDFSARMALDADKQSGNFNNYISTMQKGMEKGIVSHQDMVDNFAQGYAELSKEQRKVFLEELPPYMRQSVEEQSKEYISGWEKFTTFMGDKFTEFKDRKIGEFKTVGNSIIDGWKESGIYGTLQGAFDGMDKASAKSINELYNMKATQEDLQKSTENLAEAQRNQSKVQAEVNSLQEATGISASDLYDQLMNGTKVYTTLSDNEKSLVDKYIELQEAMKTTDEVAAEHVRTLASVDLQTGETSGNYESFINNLVAANQRGEISTDEMYQLMSEAYANMDWKARESFEGQASEYGLMVENIRTGSGEYLGILGNLSLVAGTMWTDLKTNVSNAATEMWNNATTKFNELKDTAGQIWENMKTSAEITWGDIKDSAIGQKVQAIWQNATDTFEDLKNQLGQKWDAIKSVASQKWDEIKNSAIGQRIGEIWRTAVDKFNNLKDTLSRKWGEIKDGAYRGWQNIKTAITGWVESLWKAVTGVFDGIRKSAENTWQRICNFFSGKGFRTNEQVDGSGNSKVSIQAYATGTNYVPADGLAYLHQGEAVIPAKYNKPYENGDTARLTESLAEINQGVERIENIISQGIDVHGQFVQKGNDLFAVVQKVNNKISNTILSNKIFAR